MASKAEEAQKHVQEAEKNLKSGFFKKPDYELASYEYAKAAVSFKNARQYDKAIDAYLKANDCCLKTSNHFQAAKHLSEASLICKEVRQFEQSADLAERAGNYYIEARATDSAAIALERSARALEADLPDRAVRLYEAAARAHEVDEKLRDVFDALGNAARLLVKTRRFDAAVEILKQRASVALRAKDGNGYARTIMHVTLVLLVRASEGDENSLDAALRLLDEACACCEGFTQSEDGAAAERLVRAFEDGDATLLTETVRLPVLRNAENEFAKLTRALKVDEMRAAMRRLDLQADAAVAVASPVSKWDAPVRTEAADGGKQQEFSASDSQRNEPEPAPAPTSDPASSSRFTDDDFEGGLA